jgi:carbon-monoxide dehydrogenase small subunit
MESFDGRTVKAQMSARLGPINSTFSGSAVVELDRSRGSGTIVGGGSDRRSGSQTKGEVSYRLEGIDDDTATRVHITVLYSLRGVLAQFSRSSLAEEFARQLTAQFAANLQARLQGNAASAEAGTTLNMGRLVWAMSKRWLDTVLRRRRR